MKRCPTCNRVESDDALVFCRADGTALISDSGPVSAAMITGEDPSHDFESTKGGMKITQGQQKS